ncbi:MAG TPA: TIR domain-containing protein [Pyrinomonadaceae bacterium]
MRPRHGLVLLFVLLPALVALSGCSEQPPGSNAANTNTNAIRNANTSVNTSPGPPTIDLRINANARVNGNANAASPSQIARIKEALGVGNIAFNVPPSMRLEETQTIMLLLSPTESAEVLKGQLQNRNAAGNIETHNVKVSGRMQAKLTGDGFHITPVAPEEQRVNKQGQTQWKWDVRPTRTGTLKLHVVLNAVVDTNDRAGTHLEYIDSFDQTYVVDVPSPSPTPFVAAAPARAGRVWSWLLPVLLVPAGGAAAWLWLRGRGRRRRISHFFDAGAGESRIFLSYRRDDTAGHAGRLRDALVARFGPERVFMDLESIRAGEDFVEVLKKAIDSSGVVVVVIGRQWLSITDKKGNRRLDNPEDFVRLEVETALRRGGSVIPALVQGAQMPAEDALPEPLAKLARRNAIEISDARWVFDVGRLAEAIEGALAREPAKPPEPSPLPG